MISLLNFLNIEFAHHDALEDAIAAAKVVHHACEKTGLSIEDWLQRVEQPIGGSSKIKQEGNPEGPLYGENLVFTGALFLPRKDAAKIAAEDAKLGHSEQRLGFAGAMYVFPIEVMLIGQKKARELLLTGKLIDGKEAERIGLVNRAVPADKLEAETRKLAQSMTLLPRDGIAIGKACARLAYDSMGLSSAFGQGYLGHTLFTNVRYEPGEFNFLKRRRDVGVREAVKERDARYKGLIP